MLLDLDVRVSELAYALSRATDDEILQLIEAIDDRKSDWEFTRKIIAYAKRMEAADKEENS